MSGLVGALPARALPTTALLPAAAGGEHAEGGSRGRLTAEGLTTAAFCEAERFAAASRSSLALLRRTWRPSRAPCVPPLSWRAALVTRTASCPPGADARLGRDAPRSAPAPSSNVGASTRFRFSARCLADGEEGRRCVAASIALGSMRRCRSSSSSPRACSTEDKAAVCYLRTAQLPF